MELYGSLLNISGSVTASAFTGSFIGDGSGLSGIQASGVTGLNLSQISSGNATASISSTGFKVNKNTQIEGNLSVTGALIATEYIVSSSVTYMTTSFASGSSAFGNDDNDIHQFTGSVQITGSISLNGQAIGTGKLDETTFQSYTSSNNSRVFALETSSGSLNSFTSSIITTIKSKLDSDNVISGSVQVNITETTGYNTFSSSISNSIDNLSSSVAITTSGLTSTITILSSSLTSSIGNLSSSIATIYSNQEGRLNALETSSGSLNSFTSSIDTTIKSKLNSDGVISGSSQILNDSNIVSSSAQVTAYGFATTGSNLFIGAQTHSGSILPSVDNTYDLGSAEYQWRDVYISSGSLYIDGTKVLSSTTQELTITTDNGQSLKILEGTTDSIVIQTADGDIELKSSADGDILLDPTNGKIMLKGPIEVLSGQKIQSSVGGTPVVFANDIVVSGSIDLTGTIDGIDLQLLSSSVDTRLSNLETSTGSLNTFTSSANERLNLIESVTSSFVSYSGTTNTRLTAVEVSTGSLNTFTSSTNNRLSSIETSTGSINTYTGSNDLTITTLQISTSSLNTYTSSNITNINAIHTATSSLNSFTSSINTTIKSKLDNDGVISGSSQVLLTGTTGYSTFSSSVATSVNDLSSSINSLSSSFSSTDTSHNDRLTTIEGRYTTTGSNVFIGDQTITGSLYISQNLIVQGSSSLENITASAVSIGTNTIILNADTPAIRYAGISVFDSGSTNVTASLFYDSLTNNWKFKHSDVGTDDASILLYGPLGVGIDNAPTLVGNFLTKVEDNGHGHHLTTSSIFDNGNKISLKNNTEITGSVIITSTIVSQGTTLVSGSEQISYTGITNIPSGIISGSSQVISLLPAGTVSGSSQVLNGSGVWSGSAQLPSGIVSGSSQISFNGITDKPALVSGSSQVSFNGITDKPTLVSGSSQISFGSITGVPSGLVSGSSQVLAGTTIHSGSFFNGISVVSGSSQISFNGITDKPTLVSGSSQITYGSISSIPSGIVSGSAQIDLTSTINYSSGIKTRLNAEGVLSGSAQVVAALPSGTVSGSAQITLSSTTGYGSVLNQAVLTTSAVTFAGITNNGAYSSSGGSFSHNVGNPAGTTELFVHNGANTPVPFRMTKAGYTGAGGSYGILQLYMNDNTNGNGSNLYFCANSSNGTFTEYGGIGMQIKSNTAGSATARLYFYRQERGINGTFDSDGTLYTVGNIYTNGNGTTTGNLVLNSSNFTGYTYSTTDADSRFLRGTTSPGTTGNFTLSIGNNGTYSYVQSHSSQPLELNPVGNTVRIAGNVALHAGNFTSYAMSGAGYSANQNLSTSSTVQFGSLGVGVSPSLAVHFRGSGEMVRFENTSTGTNEYTQLNFRAGSRNGYIWLGNQNASSWAGDGGLNIYTDFGNMDFWTNAIQRTRITRASGALLHGDVTAAPDTNAWLGTAVFGVTGYNKVIIGSLNSSTTGAYVGGHNSALSAWANLNIAGEAIIFRYQQTERARFDTSGHFIPGANNAYNLGSASLGWANVYTNDLHLSNMNKPEGNDVDGTNGTWTIQEGAENLYIINNNNGKKFKISLEEII